MSDQTLQSLPLPADAPPITEAEETTNSRPFALSVTIDQLLYAFFFMAALVLRLIQLGTIVLGDAEAREALAVFRVLNPDAPGSPLLTHQPLMFAVNALLMTIGGANNTFARLGTVVASLVLVLLPILFRRWIGRAVAVILSGVLAFSPVLLVASRSMAGPVWTLTVALIGVWLIGRFIETRRKGYALAASAALAVLVLACEAPGFLVALGLLVGLVFALVTVDDPDHQVMAQLRQTLAEWPWLQGLLVAGGALVLIGTVFFLHLSGFAGIGEVVGRSVQGFFFRPVGNPVAYPLLTSLLYEPLLWIFGVVGALIVLREDGGFLQRGLVGWLVASVIACLVYPGAGPEHALWLTIPLAGLSAIAIERVLSPVQDRFWNVPIWATWLHGLGVIATLSISAIHLVNIGDDALRVKPDLIPAIDNPFRIVFTLVTFALVVILFFLVGSVWGSRTAWRGLGIGLLVFLGVYSLSSGWRASVVGAADAREFWRPHPAQQNLALLEQQLVAGSLRATGMPYAMAISVDWADDGALAWAIHRFEKVDYVSQVSPALNGPAIVAPRTNAQPQLGAAYVGSEFSVYSTWDRSTMQYWDIVDWVYKRETRAAPAFNEKVVLWLRADIYGAAPTNPNPNPAPAPNDNQK